jgi:hypothetical protein
VEVAVIYVHLSDGLSLSSGLRHLPHCSLAWRLTGNALAKPHRLPNHQLRFWMDPEGVLVTAGGHRAVNGALATATTELAKKQKSP